ncbi:MAG: galactose-1-phosphate uridylyltransferase [Candidatus Schekmanbacteria bacterium RIFCSPHIGHO2_02_FULL_38_11]|uniref:Galactose-1-phosphate uridylyltransferase n=1 Tax=Candidatus Schekmanbacteria bacterium RIFCSPLOWO2_12_FULL_38_15 TaxID=1817883 RepID=A0A1F7SQC0_9BACT|nr:MAG: galactose-1-phosphate uridylyltransferase [Candidatus Schekmanbacteria bacterium GWA2_38_9]OGL50281.1 MAG: galactose-1-phosphate uridylyltransferase [Candidatus Schekmanbacteria bacterium RIFCSPLOWO2_02_FULL_38_14]OGL55408.1 MAG: galactose-1-phosphate uridylyltransferase [Candidatus Schekmanbacteria bacterium RIFCSPLOWO2_12_FULL_38_15]OGL55677.1 MAG: galactose-1-phosphate uridylyltransferase [Candidatus Schekmanbacteria bacterium RIFCSPHIGHO2_02_FULL_38_11]
MPEIRQNIITRDWVIIATERAKRPEEFAKREKVKKELSEYRNDCPFCPGNEDKTPPEIYRIEKEKQWQVRVFHNKFAALSNEGIVERKWEKMKRVISGVGIHEVVVETPKHNLSPALLTEEQIKNILRTYKERYNIIYHDKRIKLVTIFKNHGEGAGTSLEHPHSQIIGTPVTPKDIRYRVEEAMRYYDDTGECIFCRVLRDELNSGERIVLENKNFVAFIPYAALSPFHIWIFPKNHSSCFGLIPMEEIDDMAEILKGILCKLYYCLDNPDYNYVIRSYSKVGPSLEYYHWYISVIPRVTKLAGFELGSGMYINTTLPEQSARFLRETPYQP